MKVTLCKRMSLATVALAAAVTLGLAPVGVRAQTPEAPIGGHAQPSQQAPKPSAAPGQAAPATPKAEAPKINPEEDAAYKAFLQVKRDDTQNVIRQGEEFLKKYPDSINRESVYWRLATAYQVTGQDEKMFAAGEKVLELDPNNVDALSMMAWAMPRRIRPGDLDADQKLQKAETYAKHAIELLASVQKPANVTDEEFARAKNEELVSCHSGLGLVFYYQQQFPQMVTEFEQATQLTPNPDPVDLFFLGLAYDQTKRHSDAATAFTRCGQMPGPMQDRCKQGLEQAKKLAASQPAPAKP